MKDKNTPEFEATKPQRIPEIEKAANDYAIKRDARMAAALEETAARKKLIELCGEHKVSAYEYSVRQELPDGAKIDVPRFVEFEEIKKVKVRTEDPEVASDSTTEASD